MAKKTTRTASTCKWVRNAVGTEGAPLLICDLDVYNHWRGADGESPTDYQRVVLDGGYADPADIVDFGSQKISLLDTDGGGLVDIGWDEADVLVLKLDADYEDAPKRLAKLVKRIESRTLSCN